MRDGLSAWRNFHVTLNLGGGVGRGDSGDDIYHHHHRHHHHHHHHPNHHHYHYHDPNGGAGDGEEFHPPYPQTVSDEE